MDNLHKKLVSHRQPYQSTRPPSVHHASTHRNHLANAEQHQQASSSGLQPKRLLIVDDNDSLRNLLIASLNQHGYCITAVADGNEALALLDRHNFDLVLLDVILPHINGFHLCRQVRQQSHVPIILISAMNREEDVVQGLQAGADDYISKPFVFNEVQARVMAILRRTQMSHRTQIAPNPEIELDAEQQRAMVRGLSIKLSPTEYRLLQYLTQHVGHPVRREILLRDVWDHPPQSRARILHTNIRRLRQKIEANPNEPQFILTVPGVGYKLSAAAA